MSATTTLPRTADADQVFAGGGEMGARMRALDWSKTPLGPVACWPQSLKTAVSILLNSKYPMFMGWGPSLAMLYNDAYRPILGSKKHPRALGASMRETWAEIWDVLGPLADRAVRGGEPTWSDDQVLMMNRHGYLEETYFTFSYSPVRDETGNVGGMFCACTETTGQVLGGRRLKLLRDLAAVGAEAKTVPNAYRRCMSALQRSQPDIPFALLYRFGESVELVGVVNLDTAQSGRAIRDLSWAQPRERLEGEAVVVDDLPTRLGQLPVSAWGDPVRTALILPIADRGRSAQSGAVVLGVSPRRALDDDYRGFLKLVAGNVEAIIANAVAFEEAERRADALAEIDRAKTVFFSNISHEFRTPLALMLGPIEDMLNGPALSADQRDRLDVAHRNALRLLKLVNTLLDFSRIEAGRVEARYRATDLAQLTADLASVFRAAIERARLSLVVECPTLPEAIYVDRDMWEKIVLNLLSNAFKFTFEGEIRVALAFHGDHVSLAVRDTGTGIPPEHQPRLFERFHRVPNARGRTYEGSGIGLALVYELVKLHGGTIAVDSKPGHGTTFTIKIPTGSAHLSADRVDTETTQASTAIGAQPFVEEALHWLPNSALHADITSGIATMNVVPDGGPRARIVLADDNVDMRNYVARLLAPHWEVEAVGDGIAAMEAVKRQPPELVVSDIMMPGLDGFGLLRALRDDTATHDIPIILLSARAGEEARLEGINAGADDYVTKPFSARELVTRVSNQLKLSRLRRENEMALRASEERFRAMADNAPVMIWMTRPDGYCTYLSERWQAFTGQAVEAGLGAGWLDCVHPDDRAEARAIFRDANARQEAFRLDYRLRRHDGTWRWAIDAAAPWFAADGEFLGYIGSVIDITERKEAEERLALLASEVDHRSKNMLSVVQALVRLTRATDMPAFVASVTGRINALARAHTLLSQSRWHGADLTRLVHEELAPYMHTGSGRVQVEGPPVALRPTAAQSVAMALHELATNAAKYGGLSTLNGHVSVRWARDREGAVSIEWRESGGPSVVAPLHSGMGTSLIERTIAHQLGGAFQPEWHAKGLCCTLTIPAVSTATSIN